MTLIQKNLNDIQKIIINKELFSEYSLKNERYKLKSFSKKDINNLFKDLINISLKEEENIRVSLSDINDFTKNFIIENKIYSNNKLINFHPEGLEFYIEKFLSELNNEMKNKGPKI